MISCAPPAFWSAIVVIVGVAKDVEAATEVTATESMAVPKAVTDAAKAVPKAVTDAAKAVPLAAAAYQD
jgi:hypothetical protein